MNIWGEINIAVIGGGSSAVALLRPLIDRLCDIKDLSDIKISVFESAYEIGCGIAYQSDLSTLLINRPLQTMSAHPTKLNEFKTWLSLKENLVTEIISESANEKNNRSYISRNVFGLYLQSILNETLVKAKKHGILIEIINEYVTNIIGDKQYQVKTENNNYFFRYIVLCTGNNEPVDYYQLEHSPQYIHKPYPIKKTLGIINKEPSVGIIGTSLTAIDVAISLHESGHVGKIMMFSRGKIIPKIRGEISSYRPQYLKKENIEKLVEIKGHITLRDVLRLLRKDLRKCGFSWKIFFSENNQKNFFEQLEIQITMQETEGVWQAIFSNTNDLIDYCWKHFDNDSKNIFLARYHRIWLNNRTPIPITNAKKLILMNKAGQLNVQFSIKNIHYHSTKNNYLAEFDDHSSIELDYIINATGPSRFVTENDVLLHNLIMNGMIRENKYGGIDVDFDTSSVIDCSQKINPFVRLIGHNTSGVYYYVSSMQMLSKQAERVAVDLVNFIVESKNNDEDIMASIPITGCASHIATTVG